MTHQRSCPRYDINNSNKIHLIAWQVTLLQNLLRSTGMQGEKSGHPERNLRQCDKSTQDHNNPITKEDHLSE